MSKTRHYHVKNTKTGDDHLVEAANRPQAIGHVVKGHYTAEAASAALAVKLIQAGVKVEVAKAEPDETTED